MQTFDKVGAWWRLRTTLPLPSQLPAVLAIEKGPQRQKRTHVSCSLVSCLTGKHNLLRNGHVVQILKWVGLDGICSGGWSWHACGTWLARNGRCDSNLTRTAKCGPLSQLHKLTSGPTLSWFPMKSQLEYNFGSSLIIAGLSTSGRIQVGMFRSCGNRAIHHIRSL